LLVQEVAKFTNLQHLTLHPWWLHDMHKDGFSALHTTWHALQCLTCLQLDGIQGFQPQLGQLTSLQVLSVGFADASMWPTGLQHLQRLTELPFSVALRISLEDSSSLGGLKNLRSLRLEGEGRGACDPDTLLGVTALQAATLSTVRWGQQQGCSTGWLLTSS
jgi:hypothetical protein